MASHLADRLTDLAHEGIDRIDTDRVAAKLKGKGAPKQRHGAPEADTISERPRLSTIMRWTVVGGCVLWVVGAYRNPAKYAELMGTTEKEVKALAKRDAKSALALARSKDPLPQFAQRVVYDVSDGFRHGAGRPAVWAVGLGFGALSAIGAASELFGRRNARR